MSGVRVDDFAEYFRVLNGGAEPFEWQMRLLLRLVNDRRWPARIDAPTGSGKSSVIDIHVFAMAVTADDVVGRAPSLPRRLVVTVDRRALVDGHAERAQRVARSLARALRDPAASSVMRGVAEGLMRLRTAEVPNEAEPLEVAVLRGGVTPSRGWLDSPSACQVIAATPEMWGSRLLFNGYGSTRHAHPREAGLLALDSVVVVDEAHLNRQLLMTAGRVADLARPDAGRLRVPSLQVTAMTATAVGSDDDAIGVTAADLERDHLLAARLTTPKPLRLRACDAWPALSAASTARLAEVITEEVLAACSEVDGTVGCVVNTVRLATEVVARLTRAKMPGGARRAREGEPLAVRQIVGRMRPWDLAALRRENPGLFSLEGDRFVDVVVATQTIEVGVDMDFSALVTELAPGAALAQRAGRVNRSGSRASAPVTVIVPADQAALTKQAPPYEPMELAAAYDWLCRRQPEPDGLAPWAIHPGAGGDSPPESTARRVVFHRVEPWNVDLWSRTSDELFAENDLDLWLSDDLDPDLMAALVVRAGLPEDSLRVPALLRAAPPLPHEMFPVRIGELRRIAADAAPLDGGRVRRLFIVRDAEIVPVEQSGLPGFRPRPGDVLVVDPDARVFRSNVVAADGGEIATDVSERLDDGDTRDRHVRLHRGAPGLGGLADADVDSLLQGLAGDAARDLDLQASKSALDVGSTRVRRRLEEWCAGLGDGRHPETSPADESRSLLGALLALDGPSRADVTVSSDLDDSFWVVVSGTLARQIDDEARQTWTPAPVAVDLDVHEQAVALAAVALADRLELPVEVRTAIEAAGRLHDEGKADPRFQRSLRNHVDDHAGRVLAKSGMRSLQLIRRARERSVLPSSWRHEQLSAAIAWEELTDVPCLERDLAVRLVGTSHGRGRVGFPHTCDELLPADRRSDAAVQLFADAEWDLLLDRTCVAWGYWGCAFLEALFRAADGNVSRRGS